MLGQLFLRPFDPKQSETAIISPGRHRLNKNVYGNWSGRQRGLSWSLVVGQALPRTGYWVAFCGVVRPPLIFATLIFFEVQVS